MSRKPRVLIFCEYYPPARGGGGMMAMANMAERLAPIYDFFIITGDRLQPHSPERIQGMPDDGWAEIGASKVSFNQQRSLTDAKLNSLVREAQPDIVFLNSAFSWPVRRFLRARFSTPLLRELPIVLAPCGEFLSSALANKALKKRLFLAYARLRGLYRNVIWRASSGREVEAIKRVAGHAVQVVIAPDLAPRSILPDFSVQSKPEKITGSARFIFLARLVKIKNLSFILNCLKEIDDAEIELEIVGPIEDREYHQLCRSLMKDLPTNIKVTESGSLSRDQALLRLERSHYFVMPTMGENFGYVILEALAAGCPVLLSDRTDWSGVTSASAGWVLSLNEKKKWIDALRNCVAHDSDDYRKLSRAARTFAVSWLSDPGHERATVQLLETAVARADRELAA